MVNQPPTDTPFGLQPNVAAGLAYLLGLIGGIVMLAGGGTNKFVKWAACQSITLFIAWFVFYMVLRVLIFIPFFGLLIFPLFALVGLLFLVAWLFLFITAFQGREVELPVIAGFTKQIFGSQLA